MGSKFKKWTRKTVEETNLGENVLYNCDAEWRSKYTGEKKPKNLRDNREISRK